MALDGAGSRVWPGDRRLLKAGTNLARHHAPLTPPEPGSAGLGFPRVPLGLRCGTECWAGGPAVSSSGAVSCRGDAMLRRTL